MNRARMTRERSARLVDGFASPKFRSFVFHLEFFRSLFSPRTPGRGSAGKAAKQPRDGDRGCAFPGPSVPQSLGTLVPASAFADPSARPAFLQPARLS